MSSVDTAAWHDFHDELVRSRFGFHLRVCDVRVQGPTAARGDQPRDRRAGGTSRPRRDRRHPRRRGTQRAGHVRCRADRACDRRLHACRCSPGSVTRSTAAWPTRWLTRRSRRRRRARRRWSMPSARISESSERSWSAISALSPSPARQRHRTAHRPRPSDRPPHPRCGRAGRRTARERVETVRTRAPRALAVARARVDDIAARRRPTPTSAARRRGPSPRLTPGPAGAARPGQPAGTRLVDHADRRRPCRPQCECERRPVPSSTPRWPDGTHDEPSGGARADEHRRANPATRRRSPSSTASCASSRAPTSTSTGSPIGWRGRRS